MRWMRAVSEWDPFLAPQLLVVAAILLDLLLPDKLTVGPPWLLPAFEEMYRRCAATDVGFTRWTDGEQGSGQCRT